MWTEFDNHGADIRIVEESANRGGMLAMGSTSVICPKCSKPGFSWGRRRCMYCANPTEDFDPRIVHEFPPENDRIYLRLLEDAPGTVTRDGRRPRQIDGVVGPL